jgi:hypothetical protein
MSPNCPFYGRALYSMATLGAARFILMDSKGNQCGVMTDRTAPCYLEVNGQPVEWRECSILKEIRMESPE